MGAPPPAAPLSAEDTKKALYAVGSSIGKSLGSDFQLTKDELAEVVKGMTDAVNNKPLLVKIEDFGPKVQQLVQTRREARGKIEKTKGDEFLAKAAKEKGAEKLPSGLVITTIKAGSGAAQPGA